MFLPVPCAYLSSQSYPLFLLPRPRYNLSNPSFNHTLTPHTQSIASIIYPTPQGTLSPSWTHFPKYSITSRECRFLCREGALDLTAHLLSKMDEVSNLKNEEGQGNTIFPGSSRTPVRHIHSGRKEEGHQHPQIVSGDREKVTEYLSTPNGQA